MKKVFNITFTLAITLLIASCGKDSSSTGVEFAPNMYVSIPLEGLSQTSDAVFKYNKNNMTMREPVGGTIARGKMPYIYSLEDLDSAANVQNPVLLTDESLNQGKELYGRFCNHCHNSNGDGQGLVGIKYLGVPKYNSKAIKDKSMGHVFHVITYGKGRMGAHASQLSTEERWKITHYVQTLQKQ